MSAQPADLRSLIRDIPDFPRPGIGFKDITPLMADADALAAGVRLLADYARPLRVDCVVAAEARGFLLGPALALELGAGFVLARKPGKLPYDTVSAEYVLEYGPGQLELHSDAVRDGARVLVHDDLLATDERARMLTWQQRLAGTPFARLLSSAETHVSLEAADDGTQVTIELRQTLTGFLPRLGSFMVRRAAAATIEEALDGLERISG